MNPYDPVNIGRVIRRLRKERGLSQEVLSGFAGIARSHLAMIENGTKAANVETLSRISSGLGLCMSEFFRCIECTTV